MAQSGSSASLETINDLKIRLVTLGQAESAKPQSFIIDAKRLIRRLDYNLSQYEQDIEPFMPLFSAAGLRRPNFFGDAIPSLKNMVAYCEQRMKQVAENVQQLMEGLRLRTQMLYAQSAEKATRAALTEARHLRSMALFLETMNQRVAELWQIPEKSKRLELYYQAERYQKLTEFLQLERLCQSSAVGGGDWLKDGCSVMNQEFFKIKTNLTRIMPTLIRVQLKRLREANVRSELLHIVEQQLDGQNLAAAVETHDAALRLSEGEER
jgi:hypothetical protein